jgi:hypothetical protein
VKGVIPVSTIGDTACGADEIIATAADGTALHATVDLADCSFSITLETGPYTFAVQDGDSAPSPIKFPGTTEDALTESYDVKNDSDLGIIVHDVDHHVPETTTMVDAKAALIASLVSGKYHNGQNYGAACPATATGLELVNEPGKTMLLNIYYAHTGENDPFAKGKTSRIKLNATYYPSQGIIGFYALNVTHWMGTGSVRCMADDQTTINTMMNIACTVISPAGIQSCDFRLFEQIPSQPE